MRSAGAPPLLILPAAGDTNGDWRKDQDTQSRRARSSQGRAAGAATARTSSEFSASALSMHHHGMV